jgi:hypothetical protein
MVGDLDAYLRLDPDSSRSRALRTTRDEAPQSLTREPNANPDEVLIPAVDH